MKTGIITHDAMLMATDLAMSALLAEAGRMWGGDVRPFRIQTLAGPETVALLVALAEPAQAQIGDIAIGEFGSDYAFETFQERDGYLILDAPRMRFEKRLVSVAGSQVFVWERVR